jgi:hypothetical protein
MGQKGPILVDFSTKGGKTGVKTIDQGDTNGLQ